MTNLIVVKDWYDNKKLNSFISYICPSCKLIKTITKSKFKKKTYSYCGDCYQKSPERKLAAQKTVQARRSFNGKSNPNYKGKIKKKCKCGKRFSVVKSRENTAKYCSYSCAAVYRADAIKHCEYKGIYFRSSWEMKFAQYLDSINIKWEYEPEVFETSFGFYMPDFWISKWNSFVEVKGYFRDDAKEKFEEFKQAHPIILADKKYLKNLGLDIK